MQLGILDTLYLVLTSPSAAFRAVTEKRPLGWAILTALFSSVVFSFVLLPNPHELAEAIFGLEKGRLGTAPFVLIWLSLFPLALLILSGLFQVVAMVLRGRGSFRGVYCGLCFASFPLVFFAPLALLRALIDSRTGQLVYYVGAVPLCLWILALGVIAIRQNYGFTFGRAAVTCFVPVFLVFFVPVLVVAISAAL